MRVENEERNTENNLRKQLVWLELKTDQIHFKGEFITSLQTDFKCYLQRFAVSCCYQLLAAGMSASSQLEPNQMLKLDPEMVT